MVLNPLFFLVKQKLNKILDKNILLYYKGLVSGANARNVRQSDTLPYIFIHRFLFNSFTQAYRTGGMVSYLERNMTCLLGYLSLV